MIFINIVSFEIISIEMKTQARNPAWAVAMTNFILLREGVFL